MRLVLIGFGTVGQGLAELLIEGREQLASEHGLVWEVVGIADMAKGCTYDPAGIDLGAALEAVRSGARLTGCPGGDDGWDAMKMIAEAEADVMLEATFTDLETGEPATAHVRSALERGMHVVTTNKGPVALHAAELSALAAAKGVRFLFEGAVMSGTPLLNLERDCLAGAGVEEVAGILNGTTNFILTRMEDGLSYRDALVEAQQRGYAEAVPDADVEGWDALAKVTILANVVFGAALKPSDIPCRGITGITADDIARARSNGQRYKLVGRVWRVGGTVRAEVAPRLVEMTHPLAAVSGATNAATVTTRALGEVTVVGPGAGRRETGYAMLNDLLHIGRAR